MYWFTEILNTLSRRFVRPVDYKSVRVGLNLLTEVAVSFTRFYDPDCDGATDCDTAYGFSRDVGHWSIFPKHPHPAGERAIQKLLKNFDRLVSGNTSKKDLVDQIQKTAVSLDIEYRNIFQSEDESGSSDDTDDYDTDDESCRAEHGLNEDRVRDLCVRLSQRVTIYQILQKNDQTLEEHLRCFDRDAFCAASAEDVDSAVRSTAESLEAEYRCTMDALDDCLALSDKEDVCRAFHPDAQIIGKFSSLLGRRLQTNLPLDVAFGICTQLLGLVNIQQYLPDKFTLRCLDIADAWLPERMGNVYQELGLTTRITLLPRDREVKPGYLYLHLYIYDRLAYSMVTPNGAIVRNQFLPGIRPPKPFLRDTDTMRHLTCMENDIKAIAIERGHMRQPDHAFFERFKWHWVKALVALSKTRGDTDTVLARESKRLQEFLKDTGSDTAQIQQLLRTESKAFRRALKNESHTISGPGVIRTFTLIRQIDEALSAGRPTPEPYARFSALFPASRLPMPPTWPVPFCYQLALGLFIVNLKQIDSYDIWLKDIHQFGDRELPFLLPTKDVARTMRHIEMATLQLLNYRLDVDLPSLGQYCCCARLPARVFQAMYADCAKDTTFLNTIRQYFPEPQDTLIRSFPRSANRLFKPLPESADSHPAPQTEVVPS